MKSANRKYPDTQARHAIENIKNELLLMKFEGKFLSNVLKIRGRETNAVPKTVSEAYGALQHYEKTDPIKALAAYYANYIVAIRPENDHSSRDTKTRRFYHRMAGIATKKVNILFPDNPEAVSLFNAHLQSEIEAITQKRSPEQRAYLEFQDRVKTEVANINAMTDYLETFNRLMYVEKKSDYLEKDMHILMQVIERMKMANLKSDVDLYAKDALVILDNLRYFIGHKQEIDLLKTHIKTFQEHHLKLMTDLHDKDKALYLRSIFQVASIAVGSHLMQDITVPTSHVATAMQFGLGIGLSQAANNEKINNPIKEPSTHHIHEANKVNSWSDTHTNIQKWISQPEVKDRLTVQGGLVIAIGLFPALAVPVAVTSAIYNTGGVALNFYTEKSQLAEAEKTAERTRQEHESQMQKYLTDRRQDKVEVQPPTEMKRASK